MSAHSLYGPSSSHRYLNCAASVAHCENAPPESPSPYAEEGTRAHECLERILIAFNKARATLDQAECVSHGLRYELSRLKADGFPKDMVAHALDAATYIVHRLKEAGSGATLHAEQKVDISHFTDAGQFGTLDCAIVAEFDRLIIADFKYGAGVVVEPKENTQLIAYALGALKNYDYNFTEVELVVIQPRAFHESGNTIRSWVAPVEEIIAWEAIFKKGIAATKDPLATFTAGEWCKFCRGKINCPALKERAMEEARIAFNADLGEIESVPEPRSVKAVDLTSALTAADKLEIWIKAVREHAHHAAERGEEIKGFKLVAKEARRKWIDIDRASVVAKRRFGNNAFGTRELLSPVQIEKQLKDAGYQPDFINKYVGEFSSKVSSGTTLVRDTDRRPAINHMKNIFPDTPELGTPTTKAMDGKLKKKSN